MKPTLWDPFQDLVDMHDSLLNGKLNMSNMQMPATDVYEEDGDFVIEVSLPNFDEEDIEINLTEAGLEIRAEHSEEHKEDDKKRKYHIRETSSGTFYRVVSLPRNANKDDVEAHFDSGVLTVIVPIKEKAAPKKLTVKKAPSKKKTSKKKK